MNATAAFVQANGCVPCPTPAASYITNGFGLVRGATGTNPAACAGCSVTVGFVPFRSLGLSENMARDAYGRWLSFAVDATLTQGALGAVVPPSAPCKAGDALPCAADGSDIGVRKKGLCQPGFSSTARVRVNSNGINQDAAVMILSHGVNGRGAYRNAPQNNNDRMAFPAAQTACNQTTGEGAERCNADGDINFVNVTQNNDETDPFDDQMLYIGRNALVAFLGNPACQNGETW